MRLFGIGRKGGNQKKNEPGGFREDIAFMTSGFTDVLGARGLKDSILVDRDSSDCSTEITEYVKSPAGVRRTRSSARQKTVVHGVEPEGLETFMPGP